MLDELELPQIMSAPAAETIIDGRRMLYFGGTGYLGLQAHPDVLRAGCEALMRYGVHSATTRTNFGNPPILAVERVAAELTGCEAGFHFASGYLGPQILLRGVEAEFDALFVDEQAHFSVLEASRQSPLSVATFRHRDPLDLRARLMTLKATARRPLVLCDGVSPVTGAIAPLTEYCDLLRESTDACQAGILIDDAHAFGVLGQRGLGTWEHVGLDGPQINTDVTTAADENRHVRQFACVTLSKAIGGHGGLIVGAASFVRRLKEHCGLYLGATAPAAPVAGASVMGLRLALEDGERRQRLHENVSLLKRGITDLGLSCDHSPVPIVALSIGDAAKMVQIQRHLFDRDIAIGYLRSYTNLGPHGALRLAVFADHEPWMIAELLAALKNLL